MDGLDHLRKIRRHYKIIKTTTIYCILFTWFRKQHFNLYTINGRSIRQGMEKLKGYMQSLETESRKKVNTFNAKLQSESRILRVNNAMDTVKTT
jgi:hypothetical protein